ncbi:hypothetical protein Hamer_G014161 [Homarus americanus]|uniref:Uncharacterized protein n=1 Tax=Homarus americanus TaxID=6706 RepID=A0A8J5JNG3_HOMAM|nr:hypothetical protein Hamer_G014161 [Homarus americanus]
MKDAGKYPKDTVEGVWEEGGDAANATAERSTTRGGGVKSSPGGDEEENLGLTGEKAITNRENMRNRREYGRISSKDVGGEKAMTSTNPTTTTPEKIHPGLTGARSYEQLLIGKMWRFLVMADPLVAEFLVRDVDSAILPREVAAVRYWLSNSTAILHLMRDHPSHNGLILAGMWGGSRVRGGDKFRNMIREMLRWPPRNFWDYDQMMLKRVVWPEVLDSLLAHDSYFCGNPHFRSHHRSAPFPTRRDRRYFVGWGPTRDHELSGVTVCPKECRPPDHQDWSYC